MDELEDTKKYKYLVVNGVIFESVQVFILKDLIEIVNNFTGITIAKIHKENIKTINVD